MTVTRSSAPRGTLAAPCVSVVPWNGVDEALVVFDKNKLGDVPPFPFTAKGADVRGADWLIVEVTE
ncbi:hypothetical protein [Mesorhizobium sp. M6A.T.Cr.TU.016.01.1.1]|uniref:hypothetical protein n=1 Tax=Mesorhizobium sp. M6A.T.Cr.TU.016.01.1.1 TaxID=2493677 RepID=UPI000F762180|nr:hypothetical protein [Mesorhizobium sp. M6A.T.Cr.TU.016.01.1.1]AZO67645.1 hypothetical protein EJ075_23810 [Mesorhizobium sp. M6A.T.Cr.TU.016.01.1.1]